MDASTAASPGGRTLTPSLADARPCCNMARGTQGLADSSKVTAIVPETQAMLSANFLTSPLQFLLLLLRL